MIQGGAGTSTNMNANEVIANRGLELLGHAKGEYEHLHPNDHVNCSQSTNDAYPTAIKLAVIFSLKDTLAAMRELRPSLAGEGEGVRPRAEDGPHGKPGRRADDARPGIRRVRGDDRRRRWRRSRASVEEFHEINMGATAIGTGINSPPGYADLVTRRLAEATGLPLKKAANLVEATQDSGAFAQMAATMKRAAVQLSKICNDLRWLSSGPRCGLNEIHLPADAARLVDHAGQGQPRDPGTRQPDLLPDHRLRRDDLDGVGGERAGAEHGRADHRLRPAPRPDDPAERLRHAARPVHRRASRPTRALPAIRAEQHRPRHRAEPRASATRSPPRSPRKR